MDLQLHLYFVLRVYQWFSALYLDYAKWISNEFHLQEHKRIHEVLMDYMVSIYNIDTIDMKSSEILTIFGCL